MSNPIPGTAGLLRGALGAFLAVAVLAAPALAQVPDHQDRQDLATELQDLQVRLDQIEQQALQDPELQRQRTELQQAVVEAIREVDPESERKMERLESIQDELHEAQQAGDGEQVQVLVAELQEIQQDLEVARVQVMQDEDIVRELQEFQRNLLREMEQIDPEAPRMLERMQELQQELGIGVQ